MAPEEPTDFSSDSDSDSDSEAIALASTLTSLNTSLSQLELDFIQPLLAQTLADTLASLPGELDKAKLQVGLGYVIHDLVWSKCLFLRSLLCRAGLLDAKLTRLLVHLWWYNSLPKDERYQPREPPRRDRARPYQVLLRQDPER
jgi:hypothetical protein